MAANFLRAFQALSSEKEAVRKREEKLVSGLRETLERLGYRLEPLNANGSARRTRRTPLRRALSSGSKPLTCSECGRTFALPLHLGRHMGAMHKGKRPGPAPASPPTAEHGAAKSATAKETPRRRQMSPAARRAAARRMKAYWRKRKAAATKTRRRARRAAA
jgi:hypothetical protein